MLAMWTKGPWERGGDKGSGAGTGEGQDGAGGVLGGISGPHWLLQALYQEPEI